MDATDPPVTIDVGPPCLTVVVTTTLADHVDFNIYVRDRPAARRRRSTWTLAALIGGPLLGLALGFMIGWLTDPNAMPLMEGLRAMTWADWRQGLGGAALVSGMLGAVAILLHLLRRPIFGSRLRGVLGERPGIDPADPARRSRLRVTLAERGFVVDGEGSHTAVASTSVREVGETAGAFMLMVGRMAGFVVPKGDLSDEQIAAFRAVTRAWPPAPPL